VPITSASTVGKPAVLPRSGLRKFGRAVLWFVAVCLVLEVGLRAFGYGSYVIYRPDQRLLWVPMPGQNRVTEINHAAETISPQGFRYREALTHEHPGIYRMFAFGDSVTMGWGVNDDSTYSAQLEKLLNSQDCSGTKFQTISAGVNAYPQALAVERLKMVLEDGYQPNAVILAFSFNTGFEPLADLQGDARQKLLRRVELKSVARRIALYNFLIEGVLRNLVYYRIREKLMLGTWDTAGAAPNLPPSHYLKELQAAKDAADAHHVQMIMLLLGTKGEFYPAHPYQKAMFAFAHENNIPMLNMMDVMKSRNQDEMYMDPAHPTPVGQALIAQNLLPLVRGLSSYAAACQTGPASDTAVSSAPAKPMPTRP
jgi:lysophospholipase L1-like esterase